MCFSIVNLGLAKWNQKSQRKYWASELLNRAKTKLRESWVRNLYEKLNKNRETKVSHELRNKIQD